MYCEITISADLQVTEHNPFSLIETMCYMVQNKDQMGADYIDLVYWFMINCNINQPQSIDLRDGPMCVQYVCC